MFLSPTSLLDGVHWRRRLGAGAATLGLVAALLPGAAPATAATTLEVSAGTESPGGDVQLNSFAPHAITVSAGDTVTWRIDSTEFHTVHFLSGAQPPAFVLPGADGVFLNPAVALPAGGSSYDGTGVAASGLLTRGQSYSLTFPTPGTYPYLCAIHADMQGSVVVKAPNDSSGVDTQATVDARRSAESNADLAKRGIPLIMTNVGERPADNASAGITAGTGDKVAMVPRFLPQRVTVKPGDSITWTWVDPEVPHTVTFLAGETPPEVVIPRLDGAGPPRLELNPAVLAPAGDPNAYAGGPLSSGFLDPLQVPAGSPAPAYTVRFEAPGTYEYICLLHEKMGGTIVVEG
jgi:plastocyanin